MPMCDAHRQRERVADATVMDPKATLTLRCLCRESKR
eukprot:COSAG06_NODE_64968_length_258_cov_0.647799_1_plen_36_part_01